MNGSARERRLVAIGLLVLVFAILYFGVARPIARGFSDRAAERERLIDATLRGERLMAQAPVWRARYARQRLNAADFTVAAPGIDAAAQSAEDRISQAVVAQGGVVKAVRQLPGGPDGARVQTDIQVDLSQLVSSLKRLENDRPYLAVERLSVATDQAASAGRLSPMEVDIDFAVPYVEPHG